MLVNPSNPITNNVARITVTDTAVLARFTERNDRFIAIAKKQMGYTWTGGSWQKNITKFTGSAADRAAELGRALLEAGFPVEFPSTEIAQSAADGTYQPEQRHWVMRQMGDRYAGWLYIKWPRGEDWYREVMRLSGARYDPPCVSVPPEHYDEVLDFAEVNGFSLSDGAREICAKMEAERHNAVLADLKPLPKREKPAKPDHYEVADELRDDPL